MTIIKIVPHANGAHANQTTMTPLPEIPEGWAVVPEGMEIPDTFPFVGIEVEGQVVTVMTPSVVPEPEPMPETEPSAEEDLMGMAVDHELRLTMLEMGI